ncbi:hypothetical protein CC78DRAFT_139011 [Lojkania enalia]|uniref:Origin recognition complex subunit n=1 Tax=Lojkania enalia TaxID=147567 RepID=A0A9P4NCJ0_9PLEO|nr:hypothetical protein CC78DRAFT_139011 [Didymosphaeria enalia]
MEHQRCYIYSPLESEVRPSKRQRTNIVQPQNLLAERLQTFREAWSHQEKQIQTTLENADRTTQEKILDFIKVAAQPDPEDSTTIPTGLIIAGPSIASYGPYFERLGRRIKDGTDCAYLVLSSSESPNLKTLLKNLVQKATSRAAEDDDDELLPPGASSRNGPKLLNFDLGHLQGWQKRNRAQSIVIAIQDSEAFDSNVLVEMIDLFHSWLDRLPFVLLFGIATSAESFEDRLSGNSLRYLKGQKFDVTQSDEIIEKLFSATIASAHVSLRIGPNFSRRILDRQKDHVQNVQDFLDSLKYAYMAHFYANCTSIFLKDGISFTHSSPDAFEAVRNLPSFRRWVEDKLDSLETQEIRKLLDSDRYLFDKISQQLRSSQQVLSAINIAVAFLSNVRESLQITPSVPLSSLWIRAASGEMVESPLLRETMLSIKKIPSNKFLHLLSSLRNVQEDHFSLELDTYRTELEELVKNSTDSAPLRSQHDVRNDSLRTTVVAQKVLLSKHKAALSEQDKAYSELVGRFHDEIQDYFNTTFVDPQELFLSEILIYDPKLPHIEVFQPKPRFAIERALSTPHDYLGCNCCGSSGRDGEAALSATQPATALLYQLYLESGSLINVSDLWSAFNAIGGDEDSESKTMALFQRALAELKYLGLVKPSRKKVDHVAKMMWKGL